MTTNKKTPIQVFAGNNWETGLLKSILEDAGIETFLKDDLMGTINPWVTEAGGAGAIKVFIPEMELEKAIPLVKEFLENLKKDKNS
jgi:hypothetical protein